MKYVEIRELGEIVTGKTPPTENLDFYGGEYPFITPSDIVSFDKKYLQSTDRTLSALGANKIKSSKLPANSICFVCIGSTIGKMCMTNCVSYTNQQINSIIPNEKCDSDYLFYLLRYANEYFRSIGAGTGSGKGIVNKTIFSKTKMQISEKKEHQQRIASILSAYDDLIENNNKRIKILEKMAENLYKEWFVRFRFPDYQNTEFENGIPNGWRTVTLDSILSKIATGLNPRKNFVLGNGDNYYVTIKNMGDNNIYLDDRCDKVDDEAIIKINKRSDLRQGDLLFSGIGTIGRTYLINIPTNNWNISESVFTMRPKKIVSSEYLYMLLLSDDLQNYCQAKANGSAQKGIRMAVLRKYTFLLAPIAIIENFTKKARRILNLISLIREKNQNLTKQRDLLLPRLMSGKLEAK